MSLQVPKHHSSSLFKQGQYKIDQGIQDVVLKNIEACNDLSKLLSSSFGPLGLKKLIVNDLSKLFITNQSNTILSETNVIHPAAKLLIMNANMQHAQFGDSSILVVILANELLQKAKEMLLMGITINEIIKGYEITLKHVINEVLPKLSIQGSTADEENLLLQKLIESSVGSKSLDYKNFIAMDLVWKAINYENKKRLDEDDIRVVKIMGKSLLQSTVVEGMVFNSEPKSRLKKIENCKVAVYNCALEAQRTETKGTVLFKNADDLLNFSRKEEDVIETTYKELKEAGINMIVVSGTISDLALHYIDQYGLFVIRVSSKFDMRRLCKSLGASALARLGVPTAEELGYCSVAECVEIGGDMCTVIKQDQKSQIKTIILRGATQNYLDEIERAIKCGVSAAKNYMKSKKLLSGAGSVDVEINKLVTEYAEKNSSALGVLQHPVRYSGEAFDIVAISLARSCGHDYYEFLAKIRATHHKASEKENCSSYMGINIESDSLDFVDSKEAGIFESHSAKVSAIELAFDAAIQVLQIDQIIMSKRAGGPKIPSKTGSAAMDED